MESKSRRLDSYDNDPLISLLNSTGNARQIVQHKDRGFSKANRLAKNSSHNGGLKVTAPCASSTKPSLHRVNADTFELVLGESVCPDAQRKKALVSARHHKPCEDKSSNNKALKAASKTPQNPLFRDRQEVLLPPQTLVNKRKPIHQALMPSLQQTKVFISVTGDQMSNYLRLIGKFQNNLNFSCFSNACQWSTQHSLCLN